MSKAIALAILLAVLGALLFAPGTRAAHADSLLHVTSSVSYDVRPDQGPVQVSWNVTVQDNDPATALSGRNVTYYSTLPVPVLLDASNVSATSSSGRSLSVTVDPPTQGPATTATVQFDKRVFYHDSYSFTLTYELNDVREPSLLVTPVYVYLPAVASGDEATVTVTTPSGAPWSVSVEPGVCKQAGSSFACSGSASAYLAAVVEVSRPDAMATTSFTVPLKAQTVSVNLKYFQGGDASAQHVKDLMIAALPIIEDSYGFKYPAPPAVNVAQGGRQAVLGYEGLTACDASSCSITVSPVADDVTVLHELSHLWSGIYAKRWLSEGFAQLIAEETASRLPAGLIQGQPPQRPATSVNLQLDDWGNVTSVIGANQDELTLQNAGYDLSLKFLYVLRSQFGDDTLRRVNAAIAASGKPVDSKAYLDFVENTANQNVDGLFAQWVFPSSFAATLQTRRDVLNRLHDLEQKAADRGLTDDKTKAIQAQAAAWQFDDARSALDKAEAGVARYDQLRTDATALTSDAAATGLTVPSVIDDAMSRWDFDGANRLLDQARQALTAYTTAREKVNGPRNLWQRFGLLGSDPGSKLDAAAAAFKSGDFQTASDLAGRAADAVDGASGVAFRRLLIVAGIFGVLALIVLAAVWISRLREREFA